MRTNTAGGAPATYATTADITLKTPISTHINTNLRRIPGTPTPKSSAKRSAYRGSSRNTPRIFIKRTRSILSPTDGSRAKRVNATAATASGTHSSGTTPG